MEMPELKAAAEVRGGLHLEAAVTAAAEGRQLSEEEVRAHFVTSENPRTLAMAHAYYQPIPLQVGPFEVRGYTEFETVVGAVLEGERGLWSVVALVDPADGDRLIGAITVPTPPQLAMRALDEEADAAAARAINLEAPIQMGETLVVYDPGDDLFASERLMGTSRGFVAEYEGSPVAFIATVSQPVRVGDETMAVDYIHRQRVAPAAQRMGVRGATQWAALVSSPAGTKSWMALMHRDNDAIIRLFPPALFLPVEPERISIGTAAHRGDALGRRATAADAGRLVELLNGTHAGEQLFVPYTAASLEERLSRAPDLYSWESFLVSDRAAIGVWSGAYGVRRQTGEATSAGMRALVLDYGFEAGAEDEFVALLRSACAELADGGDTEVTLMSSAGGAAHEELMALSERVDGYKLISGGALAELEPGPVYIDQMYF